VFANEIMKKKAQVNIIVIVLIILISLVGIAIVWNVVNPLIEEKSGDIELRGFTTSLEIKDVVVFELGESRAIVNRKSGGELDGLRFVFYDVNGNSKVEDKEGLEELETKTYYFSTIEGLSGKIDRVSVAPIFNNRLGIESETQTSKILEVPSRVISWWKSEEPNYYSDLNLNFDNQMAISFWVNDFGTINGGNYQIKYENNNVSFSYAGKNFEFENENLETWNHVVISISPGANKLYINNVNINSVLDVDGLIIDDNELDLAGNLEEVILFSKALTSPQVEGLYNNQLR